MTFHHFLIVSFIVQIPKIELNKYQLISLSINGGNRCWILVNVNTLELIGSACVTLKINSTLSIRDSHSRQLLKLPNCIRRSYTRSRRVVCRLGHPILICGEKLSFRKICFRASDAKPTFILYTIRLLDFPM